MISIVTPMYNAAAYLEETARSVMNQTCTDWEWILVDDHSEDATMEIAQRAAQADPQGRIRLLQTAANGGPAGARNAGVDAARGEVLVFLDADDLWLPQKLEHELAFLRRTGAAFACTSYEFGDEQGRGTGRIVRPPAELTYRKALTRTVVFTSTVMLDRSRFAAQELHMPEGPSEDTALWWRIMRGGTPCRGLDEVLTIYRRPPRSLSSNKKKAVSSIWYLYRRQERLSVPYSAACTVGWAVRATLRRL